MKKFLLSSLILILLSVSLLAETHSAEVDSLTSERIGSCIAVRYSDTTNKKDLYNFITAAEITSVKLLINKDKKFFIRIKSENETIDYIFSKDDRKNVLLALQSLVNAAYASRGSGSKDKLDLFIDR